VKNTSGKMIVMGMMDRGFTVQRVRHCEKSLASSHHFINRQNKGEVQ
jgi:hypothetical protein